VTRRLDRDGSIIRRRLRSCEQAGIVRTAPHVPGVGASRGHRT
jgi:hypothetical protein